jgi:DNA-binding SARP family transcriptional activator
MASTIRRRRNDGGECRFEVLGPLAVRRDELVQLTRRSHRRLLSILLLDAGATIATDVLIDRFWRSAPPATARTALHTHLSALRRTLACGTILTEPTGYRLTLAGSRLDSVDFATDVLTARRRADAGAWQGVLSAADEALRRWRGRPFDELTDDEYAVAEIRRLEELHAQAHELRAEGLLHLGRASEAIPDLEWAVHHYPLREGFTAQLARARHETGSHADALRALRDVERALRELGLELSPALRELEVGILTHFDARRSA